MLCEPAGKGIKVIKVQVQNLTIPPQGVVTHTHTLPSSTAISGQIRYETTSGETKKQRTDVISKWLYLFIFFGCSKNETPKKKRDVEFTEHKPRYFDSKNSKSYIAC